jgi:hypothetical protein
MLYDEGQRVPGFPEIAILSNEKVDGKFIGVSGLRRLCDGRHPLASSHIDARRPAILTR